jgi:hypothetical protein
MCDQTCRRAITDSEAVAFSLQKLLFLIFSATITWPGGTYVDPARTFELHVPDGYRVRTGPDKPSDSYIGVCSAASTVCFEYPANRYPGSNFESASVEVTVLGGKTAEACINPGKGTATVNASKDYKIDPTSPTRFIDHTRFAHHSGGSAAMSHEEEFNLYRGFDKGACYELSTDISYSSYAVSKDVLKREFTHKDDAQVTARDYRLLPRPQEVRSRHGWLGAVARGGCAEMTATGRLPCPMSRNSSASIH